MWIPPTIPGGGNEILGVNRGFQEEALGYPVYRYSLCTLRCP
jgi:hypothetical protein